MESKTAVYCKQHGEVPTPLTVRIKWLPNGAIEPLRYWTPDGTCYKVVDRSASIPLSFLQEGSEGLRYKVIGEIVETPEVEDERMHSQYETYLYLEDGRFCQKNIIDERYGHSGKEYIPVTLDVFPNCEYELVYFWVHGERYKVEKTKNIGPRGSFQAGGIGLWHKVDARLVNEDDDEDPHPHKSVKRLAALTLELNKWFVAVKKTV